MDWCSAPAGTSQAGSFVECSECRRRYGACVACPRSGCTWTAPSSINRDDLSATGFIPNLFVPPLKVTFSAISSSDPVLSVADVCPPESEAQRELDARFNKTLTLRADLFLTLTEQEFLASNQGVCARDTLVSCDANENCPGADQRCDYIDGGCFCLDGYSFTGGQCTLDSRCYVDAAMTNFSHGVFLLLFVFMARLFHF
eukprot:CAMPEP_0170576042 /NCGR_PEP_ID=MMETSP0224-20130122/4182_1 /TAXON_ID=285029 /ORGANISM="Togula jolla, Strain CCCM 725" /LENGTH=199 /DNA_ID=CAMNT_0010898859 /DNA_START=70 /DNA_END=669 /DNA_ORIENTATION=+